MNWSRYKVLWITGGLSLLFTGIFGFLIFQAAGSKSELEQGIAQLKSRRDRLENESLFPSSETVEALRVEQDKVSGLRDQLLETIREGQLEPPRVVRSMFVDYVRDVVPGLQKLAKSSMKGGEQGVLLRDKEFGLSAYTQRGELPEATKLVELVLEVETTTYLSELLFSSGISELVSVTVVKPEEDPTAGRRRPADFPGVLPGTLPGRNRPGRGEAAEKPQDPAEEAQKAVQAEIDRLFEPMELELNFTVYEDLLWDVLNRLAADSNQFIVQSVSITNANENLWPQSITPPFRNERDADRTATRRQAPTAADLDLFGLLGEQSSEPSEEEQAAVPIPGLTERRQRVTGGELLDVSMRVAFYRLKPQAPATEEN